MTEGFGFVDVEQFQFPDLEDTGASTGSQRTYGGTEFGAADLEYQGYTETNRPVMVRSKMWDTNGYYMNGPSYQPWTRAKTQTDAIYALSQSWSDPARSSMLDSFGRYVNQFGHTNSAGVLWGMAQVGINPNSDVVQQILQADAEEYQKENRQSQSVRAGSPVASEGIEGGAQAVLAAQAELPEEGFNPLSAAQFAARTGFSVLSSGMEAVQGSMRMIGGALTDDDMSIANRVSAIANATIGVVGSPLSLLALPELGDIDNPYANPWAQTDFGQTLALSRRIGFEAFTSGTAGLDINKAKDILKDTDPTFADLDLEVQDAVAENFAQQNDLYAQPGWFVDETSLVGERQRQITFNTWAIPGPDDEMTAWTMGRGIASNVVGTDSEAYGVLSGLVDAVTAIATDPITYLPVVGLPSKAVRVISRGSWKIGMEADKARVNARNMRMQVEVARELVNAGEAQKARNAVYAPLKELLGRAPTQQELDGAISGATYNFTYDAVPKEIEDVAEMTRAAREAEIVSLNMAAAKVNVEDIYPQTKSMRRNILDAESVERFAATNVRATGGGTETKELADLWDDFVRYGEEQPGARIENYLVDRFGYDPATQTYADGSEMGAMQFKELFDSYTFYAVHTGKNLTEAIPEFANILRQASLDTRSVKPFKTVDAQVVEDDIGRMLIATDPEKQLEELESIDYHGIVLDGLPTKNVPVFGASGREAGVFYDSSPARGKLNIVSADEVIPDALKAAIFRRLAEVAERPDMRLDANIIDSVDFDSVPGQIYKQFDMATDPRGIIAQLAEKPIVTFNELLETSAMLGLDAVLDDILRTAVKKKRIDGITDVGNVPGRTWMGSATRVTGYKISDEQRLAAAQMRLSPDGEMLEMPKGLGGGQVTVLGTRALDPIDLDDAARRRRESFNRGMDNLVESRSNSLFNGYKSAERVKAQIEDLNAEWADPVSKMKGTLGWHAGVRKNSVAGLTTSEQEVRAFLFGMGPLSALGGKALDAIADFIPADQLDAALKAKARAEAKAAETGKAADAFSPEFEKMRNTAIGALSRTTQHKWSPDLYGAVADNAINGGGRSGLIDVLGPRLGVDISKGDISKTIRVSSKDGKSWVRRRYTTTPKLHRIMGQMPSARKQNLQDATGVVKAIDNYVGFVNNRTSLIPVGTGGVRNQPGNISEDFLNEQIGSVLAASGTATDAIAARQALVTTFNAINKVLIDNIEASNVTKLLFKGDKGKRRKAEIINALTDSTSIYLGGKYRARGDVDVDELIGTDSAVGNLMRGDGTPYEMPPPTLDSELANGFVGLPGVEDWVDGLRQITLALDRSEMLGQSWRGALRFYNNFFRTSLLVFRVAYLARNLGEMQVRMYLNGHESLFNSPSSMMAMTLGDEWWGRKMAKYNSQLNTTAARLKAKLGKDPSKQEILDVIGEAPKMPKLLQSWDRYKQTVLGTDFNVGMDEQLAAANKITSFWELLRSSNSLVDPRVYNASVRQSWAQVEYGSQNFSKGWANELVLLERSGVVKLIVGTSNERQFATLMSGTATPEVQRKIAREFMYDAKHEDLRRKLRGSSDTFNEILTDEDTALEYLFLNRNSVFNRILDFTNNDQRLINYLSTGRLNYADGKEFLPLSFTDPGKRISQFRVILDEGFSGSNWADHFQTKNVRVAFSENPQDEVRIGTRWVNKFFEVATKIERIGAVGPEFRMAYWNSIAELAPMLRGKDVARALKAANTTLTPIQSLTGKSIGKMHPAWKALDAANKNGIDGFVKLDDIHEIAMEAAAKEVAGLFYDAANRNNFWYALRIVTPFGQAWGNTLNTWTKLGAKQPLNIYKAQKLFNALQEEQSNAIYEAGQQLGPLSLYGASEDGMGAEDKDSQGGFFYSNEFGDTVFQMPLVGRALGMGTNLLARLPGNGVDTGSLLDANIPVESPTSSLNLAMGGDSISPGFSPAVAFPLSAEILPSEQMNAWTRQQVAPFGDKSFFESMTPAWMQKAIGGAGAIPGFGKAFTSAFDGLYPGMANRGVVDAMTILSTTGNYGDLTDPIQARRFKADAQQLAAATLLMTGMFQNAMPATPIPQTAVAPPAGSGEMQTTGQYTLGLVNALYQQYYARNGFDRTAAVEEVVRDFGPYAAFAMVGNWAGFSRLPTSQALEWAYENPEIAKAHPDEFPLFFPNGDSSNVEATRWLRSNTFGEQVRKNPDEAFAEAVAWLERIQVARVNSMENAGEMNATEASTARDAIAEQYRDVSSPAGTRFDKTEELEKLNNLVQRYPEISQSSAGQAFASAWALREKALMHVKAWTGDPDAGLGSDRAEPVRAAYFRELDILIQNYPDFKLLGSRLRKEWE